MTETVVRPLLLSKVGGGEQILDSFGQKAGTGLMGIGGLVAVIGGFMFLLIVLRALFRRADG